jgi:upstream activation factor subunit UAF30
MSIDNIELHIKTIENSLKNIKKEFNKLKKEQEKEKKNKTCCKLENKEEKCKPEKRKNGLTKQVNLSSALCKFLNIDEQTKMSRIEVTKKVSEYIKENNLGLKREIIVDEKLRTIIEKNKVTYFTLQKYMNKHYLYSKQLENNQIND